VTASEVGAVPDDVIEEVANDDGFTVDLVSLIHEHCGGTDDSDDEHRDWVWSLAAACARLAAHDVTSVPSVAEVIARDAKVREIVGQARATYNFETDAWGRTHLDAYDAIAALYPEAGK